MIEKSGASLEKGVNGKSPPGREVLARAKALGQDPACCAGGTARSLCGVVFQREEWRAARDRAGGAEPCGLLGRLGLFTLGELGLWRAKIGGGVGPDRCSRAPSGCCGED